MAVEIFTWKPEVNATGQTNVKQFVAQFGDGYRQVVGDGINVEKEVWPLTFKGNEAYVTAIRDFLRRNVNTSFQWTPPLGVVSYWQAPMWTVTPHEGNNFTVSTTFEQGYLPA